MMDVKVAIASVSLNLIQMNVSPKAIFSEIKL